MGLLGRIIPVPCWASRILTFDAMVGLYRIADILGITGPREAQQTVDQTVPDADSPDDRALLAG